MGLGVTGSTVIVVGQEKILTWNLVAGNARANTMIDDYIQVTTFDHSPLSRAGKGVLYASIL